MANENNNIENDLLHLARIALTGRAEDIQTLLHRIAKRRRTSEPQLAEQLTDLLRESPTRASPLRSQTDAAVPVDIDTRLQLLRVEDYPALDHEPVYPPEIKIALGQLVDERANAKALFDAGLEPTRTVLFTGPPGVGKTMTARWLARTLKRPLIILDLAAVMSSYLGRTGTNLRHVLEYAKSIDCVLLLDELDAIAKRRDDRGEIGELKRLVTVLIQQIDDWPATGLLISATNHADLLDPAIWRRYEMSINFPLPTEEAANRFIKNALSTSTNKADEWASVLSVALKGRSFSDIERDLKSVRRSAAIYGKDLDKCLTSLIQQDSLPKQDRITLATTLVNNGLASQRQAHELTGVARDTIRSRINTSVTRKKSGATA